MKLNLGPPGASGIQPVTMQAELRTPHPAFNTKPWMEALEAQLDALRLVKLFISEAPDELQHLKSWNVDRRLLETATPFSWNAETIDAVLEASKSIPLDTPLNRWNLETEAVWWHFEKPLPWQTVTDPSVMIRALCFGWILTEERDFGMPVGFWTDDAIRISNQGWSVTTRVVPSQQFEWEKNITLGEMLERTRRYHRERYGPGGEDSDKPQVGEDVFMAATEGCARFILAGLAWLGQKVLLEGSGHVERHRRKAFAREAKQIDGVRVVHLRRAETHREPSDTPAEHVEWSCRWVVSGHWRNQLCGPGRADRKLTYIFPFVKGPDDKPLRTPRPKVYEVSR